MFKILRVIIKIIMFPVILIFSIVLAIVKKIFEFIGGIAIILSFLIALFGIYCLVDPVYNWAAVPAFINAFLLSPFGLPLLCGILILKAEDLRDWLKKI